MLDRIKNFIFNYKLSEDQLYELQEVHRAVAQEKFKRELVKGNTALVRHSDHYLATSEDVIKLMEQHKNALVSQKLGEAGVPEDANASVDLRTGKITIN